MANQKKTKGRIIYKTIVFCMIATVAFSLIRMQMEVITKRRELNAMEQSVNAQELLNDEIMRLLKTDDENKYIERIARERFGFAYPDERIYYDRLGS